MFKASLAYTVQEFTRNKPTAETTRFYLFCLQELGITELENGEWSGIAKDGTWVWLANDYDLATGFAKSTYLHTHPLPEHW